MGVRMMDLLSGNLEALRYEPTAKRVRVSLGGEPVADTRDARLVWEPRRIVPDLRGAHGRPVRAAGPCGRRVG